MAWSVENIETERLRLRAFRDADQPALIALDSSPEVRRYLGGPASAEEIEAFEQATIGERWGVFCIADRDTDEVIGVVSFGHQHGELEVSYQLRPESRGRGLATEGVAAAIEWVWSVDESPPLIAVTQTANEPSRRLLARLGFVADTEFGEFGAPQSQLRLARS